MRHSLSLSFIFCLCGTKCCIDAYKCDNDDNDLCAFTPSLFFISLDVKIQKSKIKNDKHYLKFVFWLVMVQTAEGRSGNQSADRIWHRALRATPGNRRRGEAASQEKRRRKIRKGKKGKKRERLIETDAPEPSTFDIWKLMEASAQEIPTLDNTNTRDKIRPSQNGGSDQ